ncbi:hypothetical protein [Arthrobacter sp. UKPF54-2]|uniref:hypothetical protein n=1 Tax=Arthrobacter sp. UKPF54-2 TaxID=2600159 RepID=UPI0021BD9364|nr:hypothetical protein [Arthrobacter sp. UKPF54-2]
MVSAGAGAAAAEVAGVDAGDAARADDVGLAALVGAAVPAEDAALHPVSDKAPRVTVMAIFLNK